jgi:hypothetical protein
MGLNRCLRPKVPRALPTVTIVRPSLSSGDRERATAPGHGIRPAPDALAPHHRGAASSTIGALWQASGDALSSTRPGVGGVGALRNIAVTFLVTFLVTFWVTFLVRYWAACTTE